MGFHTGEKGRKIVHRGLSTFPQKPVESDPLGFPGSNGYLYRKCIELHAEYAGPCRSSVISSVCMASGDGRSGSFAGAQDDGGDGVVGRDDSACQTTPEAHPHPALRATFPPQGGRWRRSRRMRGRLETGKRSKPISLPCRKKKRFLESKEKGAPVGVRWLQIGFRRPGFTPPLRSGPVHGGLPGRNRDRLWSYPHFFRRLRGWVSERGGAV